MWGMCREKVKAWGGGICFGRTFSSEGGHACSDLLLPRSSTEKRCVSSQYKAVLVALTVGKHHVWELPHHTHGTDVHEPKGTGVVGLLKSMII